MTSNGTGNSETVKQDVRMDERHVLQLLKVEAQELKNKLEESRNAVCDTTLADATACIEPGTLIQLQKRRTLRGHFGKIVGLHWGPDPHSRFVCASQGCQLIVWNPVTSSMDKIFKLDTSFVMCCAYAPSGNMVACGGLDNRCSIYNLRKEPRYHTTPEIQLTGHDGFISFIRFVDDRRVLTSSGDETCALWDIESSTTTPFASFSGHTGSVLSLALNPNDPNLFVSGACDFAAKLWDIRDPSSCVQTFTGHQQDVNSVKYFPTGQCIVTGSEDGTCRLFDIRSDQELQMYGALIDPFDQRRQHFGITSVDLSLSGRLLFSGFQSGHFMIWDTLKGTDRSTFKAHEGQLSTLGVCPDGKGLATGSWDSTLRIWN